MSLRKLLQDQSGQFWGGFLGGLNQSMKEGRERSDKHKELELRKKQIDAQIKGMDADNEIKQHTLKQKMAEIASKEELAKTFDGTPDQHQPPEFQTPDNVTSLRNQMLPSKSTPGTPGDPRRAAMVRAGLGREAVAGQPKSLMEQYQEMQMFQQAISGQGGQQPQPQGTGAPVPAQQPPGVKFNSKGHGILSMPGEEKTPFRADDATYRSLMKKHNGNFEAARAEYDVMMGKTSAARSGASVEGRLGVTESDRYLKNRTNIAEADVAGRPLPQGAQDKLTGQRQVIDIIDQIESKFDPSFVGPLRGQNWDLALRRMGISTIGGLRPEVNPQESDFRQLLAELGNRKIYTESGKTINEGEFKRIEQALARVTDANPETFKSALKLIRGLTESGRLWTEEAARTPRGKLGTSSGNPSGVENITQELAVSILKEAGGDKDKAREIARQRGFKF